MSGGLCCVWDKSVFQRFEMLGGGGGSVGSLGLVERRIREHRECLRALHRGRKTTIVEVFGGEYERVREREMVSLRRFQLCSQ